MDLIILLMIVGLLPFAASSTSTFSAKDFYNQSNPIFLKLFAPLESQSTRKNLDVALKNLAAAGVAIDQRVIEKTISDHRKAATKMTKQTVERIKLAVHSLVATKVFLAEEEEEGDGAGNTAIIQFSQNELSDLSRKLHLGGEQVLQTIRRETAVFWKSVMLAAATAGTEDIDDLRQLIALLDAMMEAVQARLDYIYEVEMQIAKQQEKDIEALLPNVLSRSSEGKRTFGGNEKKGKMHQPTSFYSLRWMRHAIPTVGDAKAACRESLESLKHLNGVITERINGLLHQIMRQEEANFNQILKRLHEEIVTSELTRNLAQLSNHLSSNLAAFPADEPHGQLMADLVGDGLFDLADTMESWRISLQRTSGDAQGQRLGQRRRYGSEEPKRRPEDSLGRRKWSSLDSPTNATNGHWERRSNNNQIINRSDTVRRTVEDINRSGTVRRTAENEIKEQSFDKPFDQSFDKPFEQSFNQSLNPPFDQSLDPNRQPPATRWNAILERFKQINQHQDRLNTL